ncbi:MAG: 4-phosphoerythronate dehydrogenase [Candidatus Kapabacteria bacterium]|nr:4-phosphoerythronate dehydrogenase [Candidatus Kapabacteria bacterium]
MKIFIDENIPLLKDVLKNCGEIVLFKGRDLTNNDLIKEKCEFLFVRSTTKVDKDLLEGTQVKFIGSATSGTDHVDLEYLTKNNIKFSDAKGSNANSVAEYVIYSILKWAQINNIELKGRKIGVIGYGNIGKLVAGYSDLLELEIYVNDPPLLDEAYEFPKNFIYSKLEEIFRQCDIITNHIPLTTSGKYPTLKLIDNSLIGLIKKDSLFIHTSRGGVVDEDALIQALSARKFFAVIDVWENEPLINSLLCRLSFMATPHIAGYSFDGKIKGVKMMADFFHRETGLTPDYYLINNHLKDFKPINKELFTNILTLLEILESNRKFSDDYLNLLKTMLFEDKMRAYQFDELRRTYPKRRESLSL